MSNISEIVIGPKEARERFLKERYHLQSEDIPAQLGGLAVKINFYHIGLSKDKSSIGVADLNQLFEFASKPPHLSDTAEVVIYPAEKLTIEAQNKLLKLLEEPPQYLKIWLLADKESSLLGTIKSRCHIKILSSQKTDISRIYEICALLLSNQQDRNRAYQEIDAIMQAQKTNNERIAVLTDLLIGLGNQLQTTQRIHSRQAVEVGILLHKLSKGVRYNANPKLLLDRLYIGLLFL